MPGPDALLSLLKDGGLLAGTVTLIWLLATERLVPRSRLHEQREERKEDEERVRVMTERGMASFQAMADSIKEHNSKTDEIVRRLSTIERLLRERKP